MDEVALARHPLLGQPFARAIAPEAWEAAESPRGVPVRHLRRCFGWTESLQSLFGQSRNGLRILSLRKSNLARISRGHGNLLGVGKTGR